MATHFVGALKEYAQKLLQLQTSQQSPDEIVQAAADVIMPAVVKLVKQSNTELVRVLRDNPQVLVR